VSPRPERRRAPRARPERPWWKPTPKWWAQLVSGLATIAGSWIVTGAFDDVERGMSATLLVACAASWAKSNEGKGG
jgi:hypothetical protein